MVHHVEISRHAPRLISLQIPVDKIGAIIGPGGRTIRGMQEEFECRIAVLDEGVETGHPDLAAAVVGSFDGVDDETRHQMYDVIRRVRDHTGVTTLHVTHNQQETEQLANVVFRMEDGQVRKMTDNGSQITDDGSQMADGG